MDNIKKVLYYTQKLKLLYVEDNKEARESTLILFEDVFKEIEVAVDGQDGFYKFQSFNPDIIITDINMPNLNGLEMSQKIRDINSDIPILILSAHNETNYFIDSIKLDIDGYLFKPIDTQQFLTVLSKAIKKLLLEDEITSNLLFLKQYESATNQSLIVSKTDSKGILTFVNDKFCEISGYKREELLGFSHNIVKHPDNPQSIYEEIWDTIKNKKKIWKGIIRNLAKNTSSYYVDVTIQPIVDKNGIVTEYIALRNDITQIMNPKKQLEHLIETTSSVLAMMIKIKDYKEIEKLYGHKVAREIEDQLQEKFINIKPTECEFNNIFAIGDGKYVFAKNKDECKIGINNIIKNTQKFQNNVNKLNINIGNIEYKISVIMSLVYDCDIFEDLEYGIEKLEEDYNNFIISKGFAQKIRQTAKKNLEVINMVKTAIEENKIVSYFQPIVDNETQMIHKYESLVRLIDTNDKVISPFFFLDVSKKGKYYSQITHIVLKNSFEALKKVDKDISINLSTLDIEQNSTQEYIFKLLEQNKKNAPRVVFELLEDESVKNFETIVTFITKVKKYGVKIAIDDFGAGYSNFERLLDYQPDILKIDGCLIKNILSDKYSLSIIETIVAFAKKQNIQTVAEFVETKEVFELLRGLDVDYTQGYYFGKPEPLL